MVSASGHALYLPDNRRHLNSWRLSLHVFLLSAQEENQLLPENLPGHRIEEKVNSKSHNVQSLGVVLGDQHALVWDVYSIQALELPKYVVYEYWQVCQYVAGGDKY